MLEIIASIIGAIAVAMNCYVLAFSVVMLKDDVAAETKREYKWSIIVFAVIVVIAFVLRYLADNYSF